MIIAVSPCAVTWSWGGVLTHRSTPVSVVLSTCSTSVRSQHLPAVLSGVGGLVQGGRHDQVLLVCAVAVRWVVGVLATAQPHSRVLLRDEAQRHQAGGFTFVGSVAERLKRQRCVEGANGTRASDGAQVTHLYYLLPAVSAGAPRVTLPSNQLHPEGLLGGDDGFWRHCGEPHLSTQVRENAPATG